MLQVKTIIKTMCQFVVSVPTSSSAPLLVDPSFTAIFDLWRCARDSRLPAVKIVPSLSKLGRDTSPTGTGLILQVLLAQAFFFIKSFLFFSHHCTETVWTDAQVSRRNDRTRIWCKVVAARNQNSFRTPRDNSPEFLRCTETSRLVND